jgi:rubrerythrin
MPERRVIDECFEAAVEVENLMRDLYLRLAAAHGDDPRSRELFLRLAAEEEQHAQRIRLLARHQGPGTWANETATRIQEELGAMSGELQSIAREIGEQGNGLPRAALLRKLIEAERRAGVIHAEVLARTTEIEVQMLFWALARQDVHHEALLRSTNGP